jgi:hypothetical protein
MDPGEATLARIINPPDPVTFASRIQPQLVTSCALANCHARDTTFRLRASAAPYTNTDPLSEPRLLPEPFRGDYYLVLAFSDMGIPERSALIRWGSGKEPSHPGKTALTPEEESEVLAWLRSGGSSP